jgi:hypothetical protein
MRGWIVLALVATAAPAAADASLAGAPVSGRLAGCAGALERALRASFPGSNDSEDHYCERTISGGDLTIECYECTDRNCHNDGCSRHEALLEVALTSYQSAPTRWARYTPQDAYATYFRHFGDVTAMINLFGDRPSARVSRSLVHHLERAIDACLAER